MDSNDQIMTESEQPNLNKQDALRYYFERWQIRNTMDEIFPNVYLGGSFAAENIELLVNKNVGFVLTVMSKELPPSTRTAYEQHSIDHYFFKKDDSRDEDLLSIFSDSCKLIEGNVQKGKAVLVHCAMGMSRSATVMAAYVMQRWGVSRHHALQYIRSKRAILSPNRGFRRQLDIWGENEHNLFRSIKINGDYVPKEAYAEWMKMRESQKSVPKLESAVKSAEVSRDPNSTDGKPTDTTGANSKDPPEAP